MNNAAILKYTPLVNAIVGGFLQKLPRNVLRDDIRQAAMMGLWEALVKHDESKGNLDAYLRIRIQGAILDELRRQDWLPRRFRDALESLETEDYTPPQAIVRLDDVSEWEQNRALRDKKADQEYSVEESREVQLLLSVIKQLPEREREILEAHYVRGVAFVEIAKAMGVTQARISQIHSRAIARVKELAA